MRSIVRQALNVFCTWGFGSDVTVMKETEMTDGTVHRTYLDLNAQEIDGLIEGLQKAKKEAVSLERGWLDSSINK